MPIRLINNNKTIFLQNLNALFVLLIKINHETSNRHVPCRIGMSRTRDKSVCLTTEFPWQPGTWWWKTCAPPFPCRPESTRTGTVSIWSRIWSHLGQWGQEYRQWRLTMRTWMFGSTPASSHCIWWKLHCRFWSAV